MKPRPQQALEPAEFWLAGFRLDIAFGERDAAVWASVEGGGQRQVIADRLGLSRERVRQILVRCRRVLASWPPVPAWMADMPTRQRELCLLNRITDADAMAGVVFDTAASGLPRRWTEADADVVRQFLLESPEGLAIGAGGHEALRRLGVAVQQAGEVFRALQAAQQEVLASVSGMIKAAREVKARAEAVATPAPPL